MRRCGSLEGEFNGEEVDGEAKCDAADLLGTETEVGKKLFLCEITVIDQI